MSERKYSVAEIDAMRGWIESKVQYEGMGGGYRQSERDAQIEHQLRTYMLAGVGPEELRAASRKASDAYWKTRCVAL